MQRKHADPWNPEEVLFKRLTVSRSVPTFAPHWGANNHGHRDFFVIHVVKFRRVVNDLIRREGEEITEHNLGDRPVPGDRKPASDPDDGGLAYGRIAHTAGEKLAKV